MPEDTWATQIGSMRRIGFDSNALIYFLEDRQPFARYVAHAIAALTQGDALGIISTVVEMEFLVHPLRSQDKERLYRIETFLQQTPNLRIRSVDRAIARRAADVRARARLTALDAIIVATGLEERCDAIIGNDARIAARSVGIPYLCIDDYI